MKRAIFIRISGHVQGVFFRATAKKKADALGICGWVRNTNDGSVEIHAAGEETALQQFIAWCRQGSEAAVVTHVSIEDATDEGWKEFAVVRDAAASD